ncbi:MAG: hypothetical protein KatS3mg024_1433 [Armatimonadota bacterium]|nr:MAG: hypothetical protein KatS3mg024_1433 [Armatimonadota bacterium]
MKIRTVLALALLPILAVAAVAVAQAQGLNPEWFGMGADPQAGGQWKECIEQAMDAAGVTADQQAQIQSIREQLHNDVRSVRNDPALSPEQRQIKIRNLRAEAFLAIQNTLTQQQRETIRAWMAQNCARPRPRPMPGPDPRIQCFQEALKSAGLSADQRSRAEAIQQKLKSDIGAVLNDSNLTPEQKRQRVTQLTRDAHQAILALLTPQQRTAVQKYMAENCGGDRPGPPPGDRPGRPLPPGMGPGPRPECLMQALDAIGASADQKAKIAAIQEKLRADLQAVRNDSTLTPEERRQKVQELTRAATQAMQGVLTADQWAAAREWMRENCRPERPAPPPAGERPAGAGRGNRAGGPPPR